MNQASNLLPSVIVGGLLGVLWVVLTGDYGVGNFLFGWGAGSVLWSILPKAPAPPSGKQTPRRIPKNPLKILRFGLYFIWTIITANIEMAKAVIKSLRGFEYLKPAIIAVPLEIRRASEITLLANWITLTPGTLTIDVTPQGDRIFVHTYNMGDSAESFIAEIKLLESEVEALFA